MADDDGLTVTLVAPEDCGPLEGDLFSSSALAAEGPAEPGGRLGAGEPVAEGTAYRFEALPEAGAFSTEEWCLRLRGEAGALCEGYDVTLAFRRRGVFCTDPAEPNDGLNEAVALDGDGPLAGADGPIPADFDLEVPINLEVCEGDVDLFRFDTDPNDAVRAWVVSGDARGELRVGFLDSQGQPRGDFARHASPEGMPQQALAIVAEGGPVYVRVRGVDASTGSYRLFVRREPTEGLCAQDLQEPAERRNDTARSASALREIEPGRESLANASLCNPDGEVDEDWYAFDAGEGARICATLGFRHRSGNVDLQLFREGIAGSPCVGHDDCEAGAACIVGRCQAPLAQGTTRNDNEFVELPKASVVAGDYYLRVFSPDEDQNQYDVTLTVVPRQRVGGGCDPDWREAEGENDDIRAASALGSGRVAVCDAWVCHAERAAGDWYQIEVPPGADRTVHVAFEPRADGVLLLSMVDPEAGAAGIAESLELQTSAQCINVRGGDAPRTVFFSVAADSVVDDGDERVDYTLQVVPTDLFQRNRGECDRLNGGLFDYIDWPLLEL